MKAMLSIDHPAWAHQFRNIVKMLNERGDDVLTLCVDKDGDKELLEKFGIRILVLVFTKLSSNVFVIFTTIWI